MHYGITRLNAVITVLFEEYNPTEFSYGLSGPASKTVRQHQGEQRNIGVDVRATFIGGEGKVVNETDYGRG